MADEILSQEEIQALIAQAGMGDDPISDSGNTEQTDNQMNHVDTGIPKIEIKTSSSKDNSSVRPAEFSPLGFSNESGTRNGVDMILDVQLTVAVELGRATKQVREVLALGPGSVVELDKHAGEPVEVVVNGKIVARGEVVVIDENFGVRITEIVTPSERESRAKAA